MNCVVFFYCDQEIIDLPREDVFMTGKIENWLFDDWKKGGSLLTEDDLRVNAAYNDDIYEACILQISISNI